MNKKILLFIFIVLMFSCSPEIARFVNRKIILPEVISYSITDNTSDSYLRPEIKIIFSKDMNKESVNNNITLKRGGYSSVSIEKLWPTNNTIIIKPVVELEEHNSYVVRINKEAESYDNFKFLEDVVINFIADFTPPEILGSIPQENERNFIPSDKIVISFNEEMDKNSIFKPLPNYDYTGAFSIIDILNNEKIKGSGTWNGNNFIFTPQNILKKINSYKIIITKDAKDIAGNYISNEKIIEFSTLGVHIFTKSVPVFKPSGIVTNSINEFYVIDTSSDKIKRYETNGTFISEWNSPDNLCLGISIDKYDNLYVSSNPSKHVITKYDPNGYPYGWFGKGNLTTGWHPFNSSETPQMGTGNGEFNNPTFVAFDSNGNIYISDTSNDRIQKLDSNYNYITQWGGLNKPKGIAISSDNLLYVVDSGNNKVKIFDLNGNSISQTKEEISLNNPTSIAIDGHNNIYITDSGNKKVVILDKLLNKIKEIGPNFESSNTFNFPYGIFIDYNYNIYVTDFSNNYVYIFNLY